MHLSNVLWIIFLFFKSLCYFLLVLKISFFDFFVLLVLLLFSSPFFPIQDRVRSIWYICRCMLWMYASNFDASIVAWCIKIKNLLLNWEILKMKSIIKWHCPQHITVWWAPLYNRSYFRRIRNHVFCLCGLRFVWWKTFHFTTNTKSRSVHIFSFLKKLTSYIFIAKFIIGNL